MSGIDKLFDPTYQGLVRTLDLTRRRNEAIVSNIANAETPQYRASDLNFAGELERAFQATSNNLSKTNPLHFDTGPTGQAHIVPDLSGATKGDGNNVDIDIQMGQLAQNGGKYTSAANFLRRKIALLKRAITEGGR